VMCSAPSLCSSSTDHSSIAPMPISVDDFLEQARLLAALARSPCSLEVTGKSNLYWRRMENACWRSRSIPQTQQWRKRSPPPPSQVQQHYQDERPEPSAVQELGGRRRKWAHRIGRSRRSAATLLKLQRLTASVPRPSTVPKLPKLLTSAAMRYLVQSVSRVATRGQHPPLRIAFRRPSMVQRALPTGHPLLLPPSELDPEFESPLLRRFSSGMSAVSTAVESGWRTATATGVVDVPAAGETAELGAVAEMIELDLEMEIEEEERLRSASAAVPQHALGIESNVMLGMACGGVSGVIARAVVHPLDTLRVLQSVSSTGPSAEILREGTAEVTVIQRLAAARSHWMETASRAVRDGRHLFSSAYHNWHLGPTSNPLYDTEQLKRSVRILYRGYTLSVFGAQPVFAIYFGAYEAAKYKISQTFPDSSSFVVQIAGGARSRPPRISLGPSLGPRISLGPSQSRAASLCPFRKALPAPPSAPLAALPPRCHNLGLYTPRHPASSFPLDRRRLPRRVRGRHRLEPLGGGAPAHAASRFHPAHRLSDL